MTPVSPVCTTHDIPEIVFAKCQTPYLPLPVIKFEDSCGTIVSRWQLTWRERLQILFGGSIWISILTFNHELQPVKPTTKCPIDHDKIVL